MSELNNTVPVRGDITVTTRDAITGEIIRRIEIRNTVTYLGLGTIVQLWAQRAGDPAASTLAISSLRVGTGNVAPVKSNTALGAEVLSIALSDANKTLQTSDPVELKIVATLGTADGNGSALSEAGLFTAGDIMVARQIHPAVNKTSSFVIDYTWRLSFTA